MRNALSLLLVSVLIVQNGFASAQDVVPNPQLQQLLSNLPQELEKFGKLHPLSVETTADSAEGSAKITDCPRGIHLNSRVRLTVPSLRWRKVVARVASCGVDELVVVRKREPNEEVIVSLGTIERLEVPRGKRDFAVWGILIGAAVGVWAGMKLPAMAEPDPDCEEDYYERTGEYAGAACLGGREGTMAYSILGFALAGGGVGKLIRSDKWQVVPLK
jgi:hypothetical protein